MNVIEKLKRFCIYVLVIIAVMFSYEKLSASKERKGGKSLLKPTHNGPITRRTILNVMVRLTGNGITLFNKLAMNGQANFLTLINKPPSEKTSWQVMCLCYRLRY